MTTSSAYNHEPRPIQWDTLPQTLPAALMAADPDTPIIYLDAHGQPNATSYGHLIERAQRVASGWQKQGISPRQKVVLQLATSEEILTAFWGCLFAGLEPVIVPIPVSFEMPNRPLEQLVHLCTLLEAPMICTTAPVAIELKQSIAAPELRQVNCVTLADLLENTPTTQLYEASPDDIAFYTLSSGSTGLSKAVSLTHRNMISRGLGSNALCGNQADDVILSWLPFDHIGNISAYHVSPILAGSTLVYAPKEYILAKPLRWLDLIEQYRVTHGWAPNFAFGLVAKALRNIAVNTSDNTPTHWDLSSVRGLLSAGELIAHSTCEEFLAAVKPFGFARDALISAFGMAEVCSGVAYHLPAKGQSIHFEHLDRRHLQDDFKTVSPDDPQCISFACLGPVIPGMAIRIVDDKGIVVNEGVPGRFQLKGDALMPGYYRNDEANRAFGEDGWFDTGDAGFIKDGELYLMGRSGLGIVVNGVNLSNAEIETVVEGVESVEPSYAAACGVFAPGSDRLQLAVFFHSSMASDEAALPDLLRSLQAALNKQIGVRADFLIPLDQADIPKTAIGKIQHKRLVQRFQAGEFDSIVHHTTAVLKASASQRRDGVALDGLAGQLSAIWQDVLSQDDIGLDDNFFELGGDSLSLMQALELTNEAAKTELSLVDLFRFPSIGALVAYIEGDGTTQQSPTEAGQARAEQRKQQTKDNDIAVIGLACRLPGADNLAAFWRNLSEGVESITFFTDRELARNGFAASVYGQTGYVKASPLLSDVRGFDAEFFGYSARDAELMDPQHRLFLECSWEAFEDAGYDPTTYPGTVGVYAGAAMNTYLFNNVLPNRRTLDPQDDLGVMTLDSMGGFMTMVANDKDYLTTRVSYKLNLSGPSVNVQTACSTGLVSIHMACQSLIAGEADLFLAGGTSIQSPEQAGHLYQPGMIVTPDGHVRSFDANAGGTIFGSGVGAVLLKRLADAVRDGDHIYAVVKGSAVNNDAGMKVGYMAPSSDGQAGAVAEALAVAGVPANTIGLVEAHGTGTVVGDPIEVNGLTQVYRTQTDETAFCALGSVKTNVGHLQITSGTAGFIKTVLSLRHGVVPPMVNFETPNPALNLETTPFFINKKAVPWPIDQSPRRAAVNSLGIGGTNAHAVLEQAPVVVEAINDNERPSHLLLLTARTETALHAMAARYIDRLDQPTATDTLANVCFTANTGRKRFAHRLALWATDTHEALDQLRAFVNKGSAPRVTLHQATKSGTHKVAFVFTGQGSQYVAMAKDLFATQVVFKEQLQLCADLFAQAGIHGDADLIQAVTADDFDEALLHQTGLAQPAIFSVGYAMAKMWQSWGVEPAAVMGHSLGEYIAATIAGVFSLNDAVRLVSARARLMQSLPVGGQMWAISASASHVISYPEMSDPMLALAADNAPESVVIAGEQAALTKLIERLQADGINCQALKTSHAFHSPLTTPILDAFTEVAESVNYQTPAIAMVSNVSGMRASDEVTMPAYWRAHIAQPVLFKQGVDCLLNELGCNLLLEIGVRPTLMGLGMQCVPDQGQWLASLKPQTPCWQTLMPSAAALALHDALSLREFDLPYKRRRVSLPTYPFEHVSYWLEPPMQSVTGQAIALTHRDRLLGQRINIPGLPDAVFQNRFDITRQPFLLDHLIMGVPVASAACYVSMMLQAVRQSQTKDQTKNEHVGGVTLDDLIFERPLVMLPSQPRDVQVVVQPLDHKVSLTSFYTDDQGQVADLQTHAHATWRTTESGQTPTADVVDRLAILSRCQTRIEVAGFLQQQQARQITLGPSYQWPASIHRGDREVITILEQPSSLGGLNDDCLHPGFLDACFGALLTAGVLPDNTTWLPFAMASVRWHRDPGTGPFWVHLTVQSIQASGMPLADAAIYNDQNEPIVEIVGLEARQTASELLPTGSNPSVEPSVHSLLHSFDWVQSDAPARSSTAVNGHWLIVGNHQGLGDRLTQALLAQGHTANVVAIDQPADTIQTAENLQTAVRQCTSMPVHGVIDLSGLQPELANWQGAHVSLHLLQQLATQQVTPAWGTLLVTRVGSGMQNQIADAHQTSRWGLCCSARHELPELNIGLCDLAAKETSDDLTGLLGVMSGADRHPLVRLDNGRQWHRQLRTLNPAAQDETVTQEIKADRTYLISGATGALAGHVLDWLVANGAKHLALISRQAPNAQQQSRLKPIEESGVQLRWIHVDLNDAAEFNRQASEALDAMPPLGGVVHCAGTLKDSPLQNTSWADVESVMQGKALGAQHLHDLTANRSLDFFVMFSSAASVLGNAGQVAYAMANAYLDGLAQQRRAEGLHACSINWGPWAGSGMANTDEAVKRQLSSQGFRPLDPKQAIAALEEVLRINATQVTVLDCDWARYQVAAKANGALITGLAKLATGEPHTGTRSAEGNNDLTKMRPDERLQALTRVVNGVLIDILGMDETVLQPQASLMDLGLDSLMAVQLRNRLGASLSRTLPVSLAFNYPTLGELTKFLADLYAIDGQTPETANPLAKGHQANDLLEELDKLLQS